MRALIAPRIKRAGHILILTPTNSIYITGIVLYIVFSIMKKILDHFQKADPKIFGLLVKHGVIPPTKSDDLFVDICETIISQQLSTKAADTIFARLKKLFPRQKITYDRLLSLNVNDIRACGISQAKISYLRNIAQELRKGNLVLSKLANFSDEQLKETLLKINGIGSWTVEMLLMFSFGREDVFSFGDAGLRRAIKNLYGLKNDPTQKQVEKIIKNWSPYKTYAARVLWKSL